MSVRLSVACALAPVPVRVTSLRRLSITNALRGEMMRSSCDGAAGSGGASNNTLPWASVIFSMKRGMTL